LPAILAAVWLLFALAACETNESDDDNNDTPTDDDDSSPADDDNDNNNDTTPDEPDDMEIFVVYGFPGLLERLTVDLYLEKAGFAQTGNEWSRDDADRTIFVHEAWNAAALTEALSTEGAYVVFVGHSNFGLGPIFTDETWVHKLDWVTGIDDFFHLGNGLSSIQYRYMIEGQSYPNFRVKPAQIADHPLNYLTATLQLERFENIDGVDPGEAFPDVQGQGLDIYHYTAPPWIQDDGALLFEPPLPPLGPILPGTEMLIVNLGESSLPELRYKALLWKSCYSGLYFLDELQHGVVFYTLASPSYLVPTIQAFLDGVIRGQSWTKINTRLNNLDDIYGYRVFEE
jgi:hypothetical protein